MSYLPYPEIPPLDSIERLMANEDVEHLLSFATPAEVDSMLYRLDDEIATATLRSNRLLERILGYISPDRYYSSRVRKDKEVAASLLLDAANSLESQYESIAKPSGAYYSALHDLYLERGEALALIAHLRRLAAPLHSEYYRRPWSRAWLVVSSDGHVHTSPECGTCYDTTQFARLPQVSGWGEEHIVRMAGERACTVCYPSAPVDDLSRPTLLLSAEEIAKIDARAERADLKAVREAARIAKAATKDGSELVVPLVGRYAERFRTETAARQWLVEQLGGKRLGGFYERLQHPEGQAVVIAALADKHGLSEAVYLSTIETKVQAWVKRNK